MLYEADRWVLVKNLSSASGTGSGFGHVLSPEMRTKYDIAIIKRKIALMTF